jgi:23S rRNA pseudouridine2605 synthase
LSPGRDHIRVDGKLLQGAERHRYFMLNKPRGYVTTVSDPEHRPTVMEFFAKAQERVYPVGRLDYLSEGLLLMTNDGELANLLSKAGSGVEKTYLVKVAGKPSAEELERLRGGVTIEKGEPGSARVRTAPARVREFREGDNPWFEVVLTEGRNRELRKMFAAIGHFAEKIRRVGYGPLVLDVEPGNMRELGEDEVNALRLTAEGKMKPRRPRIEKLLPKEAGVAAEKRDRPRDRKFDRRPAPRQDRGERPFSSAPRAPFKPRGERPEFRPAPRREGSENRFGSAPRAPFKPRSDRPEFRSAPRQDRGERPFSSSPRPPFKPRTERPEFRSAPRQDRGENRFGSAPRAPFKPRGDRPEFRSGPRPEPGEFKPRIQIDRVAEPQRSPSFDGKPKPSFGGKPAFRGKPSFGGKPGSAGKYRGNTKGGPKRGASRPGAPRGGRKRG